jgi:hypothetical protein
VTGEAAHDGAPGIRPDYESRHGIDTGQLHWAHSPRCSANSCVEIASLPEGGVAVRDGKSPGDSPVLIFTRGEWDTFTAAIRAGEFG